MSYIVALDPTCVSDRGVAGREMILEPGHQSFHQFSLHSRDGCLGYEYGGDNQSFTHVHVLIERHVSKTVRTLWNQICSLSEFLQFNRLQNPPVTVVENESEHNVSCRGISKICTIMIF